MYTSLDNCEITCTGRRRCTWPAVLLIFLLGLLYLYVCYVGDQQQDVKYHTSSLHLTTRYTLNQMREFAFKNALADSYRPLLYNRLNFSFNRIFENEKNKLVFFNF